MDLLTRYVQQTLRRFFTASLEMAHVMFRFSYLQGVGEAGENAAEFFNLYSELMKSSAWKGHLASNGALLTIKDLITKVGTVVYM